MHRPPMNQSTPATHSWRASLRKTTAEIFAGLVGLWIAVALIKLGNPIILDSRIETPSGCLEAIFQPWPVSWGYVIFGITFLAGFSVWKWSHQVSPFLLWAPAAWLVWQCVASLQRLEPADAALVKPTLAHFTVCVSAFYLGLFALSRCASPRVVWVGILGGWLIVVWMGWRQHFGGLEEMRDYFYSLPNWREQPPELMAKLASNRIFSTLVYPNALAGVIILFSPAVIGAALYAGRTGAWGWRSALLAGTALIGALGCLIWSGSKAGWAIALGLSVLVLLIRVKASRVRLLLLCLLIAAGVGGFWLRYRGYFERGATSVSARFDYWDAALSNVRERPWVGSGPGTFMNVYRRLKSPTSEMTRLVHNDYLEQATDSGVLGGVLFVVVVAGSLWVGYRGIQGNWIRLGVWLGVLGVSVQSLFEFGLYVPALAWPWFLGMGWLLGHGLKTVDKGSGSS